MGCFPKKSYHTSLAVAAPNPDPSRYKFIRQRRVKGHLVVELEYLDCSNYEGRKILVYKNVRSFQSLKMALQDRIDPHFSKSIPSPFARFEPTEEGWMAAVHLADLFP